MSLPIFSRPYYLCPLNVVYCCLFSKLRSTRYFIRFMCFSEISVNSARKLCQNERKRKGGKALIRRTLLPNLLICNFLPFIF